MSLIRVFQLDDYKDPYEAHVEDDFYEAERMPLGEIDDNPEKIVQFFLGASRSRLWRNRGMRPLREGDRIVVERRDRPDDILDITKDQEHNSIPGWQYTYMITNHYQYLIQLPTPVEHIDVNFSVK